MYLTFPTPLAIVLGCVLVGFLTWGVYTMINDRDQ
jgi:nitrogen fixation-related uncharacterized protein